MYYLKLSIIVGLISPFVFSAMGDGVSCGSSLFSNPPNSQTPCHCSTVIDTGELSIAGDTICQAYSVWLYTGYFATAENACSGNIKTFCGYDEETLEKNNLSDYPYPVTSDWCTQDKDGNQDSW